MKLNKLSPRFTSAVTEAGLHSDGGGLYLNVTPSGAKSWRLIWKVAGRRREMGLGSFQSIGLADARKLAADARAIIAAGGDPIAAREAERRTQEPVTFREVMESHLATKVAALRNEKHKAQWRSTLEVYAAKLLPMAVEKIETMHVLAVLTPIWRSKPETADRVRGRIEAVLNAAKAQGQRAGENPASWRGHLSNILPGRSKLSVQHFAARDWRTMPALYVQIREDASISAACLSFIILTACRSGEARGARWNEIDAGQQIWTVPAERTKTGREHRVPLGYEAMAVLDAVRPLAGDRLDAIIFPNRKGTGLSDAGVSKALHKFDAEVTTHGMRSAFRDWAGEATAYPRELAEQALAHVIGSAVEQAYRRGDALEKRRSMMSDWCRFLTAAPGANVVMLRGGSKENMTGTV